MLKPLKNNILFQFLDETHSYGKREFIERTSGMIVLPTLHSNQQGVARWAKAVAVGPDVDGVEVGDYILIEPLEWSFGSDEIEGIGKVWRTFDTKVMMVTNDIENTYTF